MGNPILRRKSLPVADDGSLDLDRLIPDMIETMNDAGGVGLAAPQIGLDRRVIIFMVPAERLEEGETSPPEGVMALINPEFEPVETDMVEGLEGCLSMPGLRGLVPRYRHIRYCGRDAMGREIERIAKGFHARVVQHEIDHLDGVLFIDRMRDLRSLSFESEMANLPELAAADSGESE